MKKLVVLMLIGMLTLTGCSGGSSKNSPADPAKDSQVAEYAKEVSSDLLTVDAVILGKYYKLPCTLKDFTSNGWSEDKEYNGNLLIDTIELKPESYVKLKFISDTDTSSSIKKTIELVLYNNTTEKQKISDETQVIGLKGENFYLESKDFVSKKGIALNSKISDVNATFKDVSNYNSDEFSGTLSNANEDTIVSFHFSSNDKVVSSIKLETIDLYSLNEYRAPADVEKELAEQKQKFENGTKKYLPNNYSALVNDLKTGTSASLIVEGTVTESVSITSNGFTSFATGSGYVVNDANGNTYILKKSSSDAYSINIGDTVKTWANSYEVIQMDDSGEVFAPYLKGDIIEVNGTEVYNYYTTD